MLLQNDKNGNMFISAVPFQVGLMKQFLLSNLPQPPVCTGLLQALPGGLRNTYYISYRKRAALLHAVWKIRNGTCCTPRCAPAEGTCSTLNEEEATGGEGTRKKKSKELPLSDRCVFVS